MITFTKIAGQQHYDGSPFPLIVEPSSEIQNIADAVQWVSANKSAIAQRLDQAGAILFRGFPIDSAQTFDDFSNAFQYPHFTYQESLSNAVRINHTPRVFTANEAPKDVEIYLHHEMAQTPISPEKLFFFCLSAADSGGATPLCRSDQLFTALEKTNADLAEKFERLGIIYQLKMPAVNAAESGQGRSWKNTLSVADKQEAESKLKRLAYRWSWTKTGELDATTPVLPAVRTLTNGKKVFYNQLIAAYLGWQGARENPSSVIRFGDDSPIPRSGLDLIVELAKQFTFDLNWQDGDVALVDNKMAMHGRRSYSGERVRTVLVALAA